MLIDTHLHLDEDSNISNIISKAKSVGVDYLIVSGTNTLDNTFNDKISKEYNNVFISCGFHPEFCSSISDQDFELLENIIKSNPKVVAIGEIGLDYHYGSDNKKEQIVLFKKCLDLASKYNLPVVIHTRDAFLDTYNILKEYDLRGVIHCFSGSLEVAKQYISLGYYLGIGGVVTFNNSKLKDVIREIGVDNVVFETDSPYLSPYRGMVNEPSNIRYICKFLADYLDMDENSLAEITSSNAKSLFDLNV